MTSLFIDERSKVSKKRRIHTQLKNKKSKGLLFGLFTTLALTVGFSTTNAKEVVRAKAEETTETVTLTSNQYATAFMGGWMNFEALPSPTELGIATNNSSISRLVEGHTATITYAKCFDFIKIKPGAQTRVVNFEVTYQSAWAPFGILDRIELNTYAVMTEFFVGEEFNPDGLIVTAYDEADIPKNVTAFTTNLDSYIFSAADVGTTNVTVTYEESAIVTTAVYEISIINQDSYQAVTTLNDLHIGARYIITGVSTTTGIHYLSTSHNENNITAQKARINGSPLVETNLTQVFVLEAGTVAGTYAFKTVNGVADKYFYASSSGSNDLKTQSTNNANGSWAVSFDAEGIASVIAQGNSTRNILSFNQTSTLFSSYGNTDQRPVVLNILPSSIPLASTEAKAFASAVNTVTVANADANCEVVLTVNLPPLFLPKGC